MFSTLKQILSKIAHRFEPVWYPVVRIEKTSSLVAIPQKGRYGDAAYDIKAAYSGVVTQKPTFFRTELNIAIPEGHVGLVCSRSGLSTKGIFVVNAPGVIDANYRGEIGIVLASTYDQNYFVRSGDRIAQLLIVPVSDVDLVEAPINQVETERGSSGFGSSGK